MLRAPKGILLQRQHQLQEAMMRARFRYKEQVDVLPLVQESTDACMARHTVGTRLVAYVVVDWSVAAPSLSVYQDSHCTIALSLRSH